VPALGGSVAHPLARTRRLGGQHPIQQDSIGDRAAEAAQAGPHRGHDDARRLGQPRAKLADRPPNRIDLARERT
jgi:hypothetical protein